MDNDKIMAAVSVSVFLLTVAIPTASFAQDNEGDEDTVVGSIFAEGLDRNQNQNQSQTSGPQDYRTVNRAELIDGNGNIQNPGGAGNENLSVSNDEGELMTRPTNLAQTILPQSIQSQEYQDIKITLQASGYAIADMQYTLGFRTDTPMIIVRGIEGVPTQPNIMDLEAIGQAYGYMLVSHVFIGGAWETVFESVTGASR